MDLFRIGESSSVLQNAQTPIYLIILIASYERMVFNFGCKFVAINLRCSDHPRFFVQICHRSASCTEASTSLPLC